MKLHRLGSNVNHQLTASHADGKISKLLLLCTEYNSIRLGTKHLFIYNHLSTKDLTQCDRPEFVFCGPFAGPLFDRNT